MKQEVLFLKLHIFYCGSLLLNLNFILPNQGLTLEEKNMLCQICVPYTITHSYKCMKRNSKYVDYKIVFPKKYVSCWIHVQTGSFKSPK